MIERRFQTNTVAEGKERIDRLIKKHKPHTYLYSFTTTAKNNLNFHVLLFEGMYNYCFDPSAVSNNFVIPKSDLPHSYAKKATIDAQVILGELKGVLRRLNGGL